MKKADLSKGMRIPVRIDSLGSGGEGVARFDDFVVFVRGGAPGDECEVELDIVKRTYAAGRLVSLTNPSPVRKAPECRHFGRCGGCQLQHVAYDEQIRIKERNIVDAIERIGGVRGFDFGGVLPTRPFGYRNKVQFVCSGGVLGLYQYNSHDLVRIDGCMLQTDLSNEVLRACSAVINDGRFEKRALRHLGIRTTSLGFAHVTFVASKRNLTGVRRAAKALMALVPAVKGVTLNVNPDKTNVILGRESFLLCGDESVTERVLGVEFKVNCESFFQVNRDGAEEMVRIVLSFLPERSGSAFLDAYCGSGFFSMFAAGRFARVVGVEENPSSVAEAMRVAASNGISNAEFVRGRTEEYLAGADSGDIGCALVDPPRKGLDPSVAAALSRSGAERVIYVSCNPATLARDLRLFVAGGFRVVAVKGIDMFPQTSHVETVVLLCRENI